MNNYSAPQLIDLLASRHSADVFVSECKDGPTHFASHVRMDAWAMRRSWRHPCVTAYEVKASRSDFLGDGKWRAYLPYCNEFYFVAAPKVIDPAELPADTGLLVCSVNACRLFRRKQAPYREVEIPESIYRYILYSRAVIDRERHGAEQISSVDFWVHWLADRKRNLDLGRRVGKTLRKMVARQISEVAKENRQLKQRMEHYGDIRETLERLGIKDGPYLSAEDVERRLSDRRALVPKELVWTIKSAQGSLKDLLEEIAELTNPETDEEVEA